MGDKTKIEWTRGDAGSAGASRALYRIVHVESTPDVLVIRDLGPWDRYRTLTNDAEAVVRELWELGLLAGGRRLFYYDSLGVRDELLHADGVFKGFAPGPG